MSFLLFLYNAMQHLFYKKLKKMFFAFSVHVLTFFKNNSEMAKREI